MALHQVLTLPPNGAADPGPAPPALDATVPLRLDSIPGAWLVEGGDVDLFAMAVAEGELSGIRYPIGQVRSGQIIVGLPAGTGRTVIAVGRPGAGITPLGGEHPAGWPAEVPASLIEGWIGLLASAVFGEAPAWPEYAAEVGQLMEIAAGQRLHAPRGVVFVTCRAGSMSVGDVRIAAAETMPIAAGLGLRADSDCRVALIGAGDALAEGLAPLDRFHAAVLAAIGERMTAVEEMGRKRIAARDAANRRSLSSAWRQMANVAARVAPLPEAAALRDPAVAAFAAVAARQGIDLPRTPRRAAAAESAVRSLARANGVGLRQVLLRGDWWRSDSGPLLARRGDARHPVALLPEGRRRYRLIDPNDGSSTLIGPALAAEVEPSATMLYRPVPAGVRSILGFLAFARRGIGRELATIAAAAVLGSIVAALFPIAVGFLLSNAVPRADVNQVLAVIAGLALAGFGSTLFDLTKAVALLRIEGRLEAAMQPGLMHRLMGLPVRFFRSFGTGDLTNRLLSIQTIRRLVADNSLMSVLSMLSAAVSFLVILAYSPLLALVAAALTFGAAAVAGGLAVGELRQERARIGLRGREDDLVLQIIQGVAKLRVSASEARLFGVWASVFARQKRHGAVAQRYAAASANFTRTYSILAMLALFYFASRLLQPDQTLPPALGLGGFLAVSAAFGQLLAATTTLARALASVLEIVPLFERLRPIIGAEPESRFDKRDAPPLSGHIEIVRVTFRYEKSARLTIDELSLSIEPGSFVALVGPSGSGKSTLLRLLLGFETPATGDILYDGQSISMLDAVSLRRQIGVVLQNGRIKTGSIFENITGGLPYSMDEARAAARLAQIEADIDAMPMGMHTLLIEGSPTLSGGQRQRLMIARALIGRPRILLFDEATSALDNQSQALVTRSLERLQTTRIVVAHRLSTVERADRIFVLQAGRLVESGTFPELMASGGLFRQMTRRQLL